MSFQISLCFSARPASSSTFVTLARPPASTLHTAVTLSFLLLFWKVYLAAMSPQHTRTDSLIMFAHDVISCDVSTVFFLLF